MTNYERIKNMSVEEMADLLCSIHENDMRDSLYIDGHEIRLYNESKVAEWLNLEVEE